MTSEKGWIRYAAWENGEYIITVDGKPIGCTVSEHEATVIVKWLMTAIKEIRASQGQRQEEK